MNAKSVYAVLVGLAIFIPPAMGIGGGNFQVASEKQIPPISSDIRFGSAALSPDGKRVLIVTAGRLSVRPLESLEEKQLLPPGSLTAALGAWAGWSPDGKWIYYLLRGDHVGTNDLWRLDAASLQKERLIKNAGGVSTPSPRPSPDGKSIAFFRGQTLKLAGPDGLHERVLQEHADPLHDMVWSPDSSQILLPTGDNPYVSGTTKLNLITVSTGTVKPLTPWKGVITSMVWPLWSPGPFVSLWPYNSSSRMSAAIGQIWHVSLPKEVRSQVTQEPASYFSIFGAGPDGHSLVAQRMPPPFSVENVMDYLESLVGASGRSRVRPTVVLMLKE